MAVLPVSAKFGTPPIPSNSQGDRLSAAVEKAHVPRVFSFAGYLATMTIMIRMKANMMKARAAREIEQNRIRSWAR